LNSRWDEFPPVDKKNSLAVLAAKLGPLGHGPGFGGSSCWGKKNSIAVLAESLDPFGHGLGFGGFLYPGKPVWIPLNEKTVGPFPPRVEFFF